MFSHDVWTEKPGSYIDKRQKTKIENTPQLTWEWKANMYENKFSIYTKWHIDTGWKLLSKVSTGRWEGWGVWFSFWSPSKVHGYPTRWEGRDRLPHAFTSLRRLFLLGCTCLLPRLPHKCRLCLLDSHGGIISCVRPSPSPWYAVGSPRPCCAAPRTLHVPLTTSPSSPWNLWTTAIEEMQFTTQFLALNYFWCLRFIKWNKRNGRGGWTGWEE